MRKLTQSIARSVMVLLVQSADHVTGATGLTLTITASKAGAAFAGIAPVVTERGSGWYSVALTASHTDTLGDLALHITAAGADPLDVLFDVQESGLASADFVVRSGTAVAGAGSSITLDAGASAVNDIYVGLVVVIVSGTGAGQARVINDYDGGTQVASVENPWATNPDNTSVFRLLAAGHPLSHSNGNGTNAAYNLGAQVWDSTVDDVGLAAGSYGELLKIVQGLSNGMMVMDNTTHDANGLTAARLRVFADQADVTAATDGGVGEGEIATFALATTYDAPGQVNVFRSRRTS